MAIVGGFDVHRAQITFDQVDIDTGEVRGGQIRPATRANLRRWLEPLAGHDGVAFTVEGCTGWRFVAEELARAGVAVHVAEPADTATLRGKKKRAKTDRADARHLRELLVQGRIPESWVPPTHVLEVRSLGRLYVGLMDERRQWQQRIHAQLFHRGVPPIKHLLTEAGRQSLDGVDLSPAAHRVVEVALSVIDHLSGQIDPLRAEIIDLARRQTGCRALMSHYGIGALTAPIIWAEMGDCRRFSSSDKAVRHTGLDITVWSSDNKRAGTGHLARQGPPALRWALVEAAQTAARSSSPDHAYYLEVKARTGANRAALSVARKLAAPRPSHSARPGRRRLDRSRLIVPAPRAVPTYQLMSCGRLPTVSCRQPSLVGPERTSGRRTAPGITPSIITSPDSCRRSSTEIRQGVPARTPNPHPTTGDPTRLNPHSRSPRWPPTSMRPSSTTSRSYVLASLRALHLDTASGRPRPRSSQHEPRTDQTNPPKPFTGGPITDKETTKQLSCDPDHVRKNVIDPLRNYLIVSSVIAQIEDQ